MQCQGVDLAKGGEAPLLANEECFKPERAKAVHATKTRIKEFEEVGMLRRFLCIGAMTAGLLLPIRVLQADPIVGD